MFARSGYDGVSMRLLAYESGVGLSSIYHFFKDKDVLLREVYEETNRNLGTERAALPAEQRAEAMLNRLVRFQFEHMEDVVFVLKYYMQYRQKFAELPSKTLPPKSVLHIEEVLHKGIKSGEYDVAESEIRAFAKVVAHTINGYLLEYYPYAPEGEELEGIIKDIVSFAQASFSHQALKS